MARNNLTSKFDRVFAVWLILVFYGTCIYSQDLILEVPNRNFKAEAGTGIDTRLKVTYTNDFTGTVYLSAIAPDGVGAVLQPDTISKTDTIILSVFVTDTSIAGQKVNINIKATDHFSTDIKSINIDIIAGSNGYMDDYYAQMHRDSAIEFIHAMYPAVTAQYGDLSSFDWEGFYPYPPLDIVSHYVYLNGNWRINVHMHVMVPPDDWKKVFVYNKQENECWGVNIDTDGIRTEIPCQEYYYFYQDTNQITGKKIIIVDSGMAINYPNPFHHRTTITFPKKTNESYDLIIYRSDGVLVRSHKNIRDSKFEFFRGNLPPGIFYYNFIGPKTFRGRMIIL